MNKYWSNEDDKKVSYTNDQPAHESRSNQVVGKPANGAVPERSDKEEAGALSAGRRLSRHENRAGFPDEAHETPNYSGDRSTFISEAMNVQEYQQGDMQFAPPPKFPRKSEEPAGQQPLEYNGDGYQVHSEQPPNPPGGREHRHGFLKFLVVLLVLSLIGGGAYLFRYQILELIGEIFGEEVVWKIMPTSAPTGEPLPISAYVESAKLQAKTKALQEINAIAENITLDTYLVTEQNIVQYSMNHNGTFDYYLFAADNGRLLGYYEGLQDFVLCAKDIFYIDQDPYLITARGFPLVDLAAFSSSAGNDAEISPMINGWSMISGNQGTALNFVGTDGDLISDLWFIKAFPFTANTTLAYVDTGNPTDLETRYALYLLQQDGETTRLDYMESIDDVLESICGMAFMQNGDMHSQDEELTFLRHTDDVAAYVNCGALAVRDPDTMLYGLFVDGVQQYPFEFDSIEPMPSDLKWSAYENGYVKRYAVDGHTYPLPRSYSFLLKRGDTQQTVSIAASSVYPVTLN